MVESHLSTQFDVNNSFIGFLCACALQMDGGTDTCTGLPILTPAEPIIYIESRLLLLIVLRYMLYCLYTILYFYIFYLSILAVHVLN